MSLKTHRNYFSRIVLAILALLAADWAVPATAGGQIFVASRSLGTVSEYTTSGATVNPLLVTGLYYPAGIAVSGGDIFVTNFDNTIREYTTSGAKVSVPLITGLNMPVGITVSGSDLFVTNAGIGKSGTIGEYTTSGATVNASLVTGLSFPTGIAVSGGDIFVTNRTLDTVGEYTTSGVPVNPALVSGLDTPEGIVVSGGHLFVAQYGDGTIGEYDASTGAVLNPALVTGLHGPYGMGISGENLFVSNRSENTIGEYTTSGATVNAALVTGLFDPYGIAVVPEPSGLVLAAVGFLALVVCAARLARQRIAEHSTQRPENKDEIMPRTLMPFVRAVFAAVLLSILAAPGVADQYLLVNGQTSQNTIRFDLGSGASSLYAQYKAGAFPRNLAIDPAGNLFSSLNGGNLNVVKLVPQQGTSVLGTTNFTANAGGDGPGQIQFYKGDLYVAGDEARVIFHYNGTTGALISEFSSTTSFNIRAMVITGDTLYYEEAFQNRVREFDLTQNPPTGTTLFQDLANLNKATNMTIGPQGILVLANSRDTLVQEYSSTGTFLGTLANVKNFDSTLTAVWDVLYSPSLQNYFVSAGNEVFRLDVNGALLQTYKSGLLQVATGLLIVPEPSSLVLAAIGLASLAAWGWRQRFGAATRVPRS